MDLGLSFAPTNPPGTAGRPGQAASNPVQDAIKILSFRLPSVLGANAPAAPGILQGNSGGMGSQFNNPLIENLLRLIAGQGGQGASVGLPTPVGTMPFQSRPPHVGLPSNEPRQPFMPPLPASPQPTVGFGNGAQPFAPAQTQAPPSPFDRMDPRMGGK